MFSEDNVFEIDENKQKFNEMCSSLKCHPFPSPWKMFFKSVKEDVESNSEVSEFVIDIAMETDSNLPAHLDSDVSQNTAGNITIPTMDHDIYKDVLLDEKKVGRLKESLMTAQDNSTIDHLKDVDIFFVISTDEIPKLFKMLDVSSFSEASVTLLLNTFLHYKDKISMATATGLVCHIICPVIFEIKRSSLRSLLTTILQFSEAFPKAVIDEMMVPYLKDKPPDDLQLELFFQVSKVHLPDDYVAYCIKSILESTPPVESSFAILQSLIERKVHHETALYDILLKKLLSWTQTCNNNVKFTKLLTSILSAYGSEFTNQQIVLCDDVIKTNKTIIKKAAENLLKKLKQEVL